MIRIIKYVLVLLVVFAIIGACSEDQPPVGTPSPTPAPVSEPLEDPTPTPEPEPEAEAIDVDDLIDPDELAHLALTIVWEDTSTADRDQLCTLYRADADVALDAFDVGQRDSDAEYQIDRAQARAFYDDKCSQ